MKYNVRIALILAAQHEIERLEQYYYSAELKIKTDENLKDFWKNDAEFWKNELVRTQEGLEWLQAQPHEGNE